MVRVASLHIYPIKSLGGVTLDSSPVEARGLRHDRRWMLVDEEGVFLSQRTLERMALFRVALAPDGLSVRGPSGSETMVPFVTEGEGLNVRVWRSEVKAIRVGEDADRWFTEELGRPARLVFMPDDSIRPTHSDFTRPGEQVGFADAFPVLVVGVESLSDLNSRLNAPLPMNRFRANVIVDGCLPFAEDNWPAFNLAGIRFRWIKHCGRCRVTTTDQETAEIGQEPLRTLATYRREDQNVIFGTYYMPEGEGKVNVGDELFIS